MSKEITTLGHLVMWLSGGTYIYIHSTYIQYIEILNTIREELLSRLKSDALGNLVFVRIHTPSYILYIIHTYKDEYLYIRDLHNLAMRSWSADRAAWSSRRETSHN